VAPIYDVAVVGAGPNGLTAAAYFARAGPRVVVLERRFERGGTFATDDYSTPFQYNLAQFALPLGESLPPYRDLDIRAQSVRFIEPAHPFSARIEPGGPELVVGRGGRGLGAEVEGMLAEAQRPRRLPLSPAADEHDRVADSQAVNQYCARPPGPSTRVARGGRVSGKA
jgi:phytoene dehydrogenase-like protein